jgi:superfamily I DNA and/or RNA helicase
MPTLLKRNLAGALVGRVDNFLDREAPVAIVSIVTFSEDDLLRGIGFLFAKNRLNVALSRAISRALSSTI